MAQAAGWEDYEAHLEAERKRRLAEDQYHESLIQAWGDEVSIEDSEAPLSTLAGGNPIASDTARVSADENSSDDFIQSHIDLCMAAEAKADYVKRQRERKRALDAVGPAPSAAPRVSPPTPPPPHPPILQVKAETDDDRPPKRIGRHQVGQPPECSPPKPPGRSRVASTLPFTIVSGFISSGVSSGSDPKRRAVTYNGEETWDNCKTGIDTSSRSTTSW